MAWSRPTITSGVTRVTKALFDKFGDGIDEAHTIADGKLSKTQADEHYAPIGGGAVSVAYPADFPPLVTLPNMKIYEVGGKYFTNLDIDALRPPKGTVYWVSPAGLSSNAGTQAAPLTPAAAIAKADAGTIMFLPGEYNRYMPPGVIGKSLNLIAAGPGVRLTGWETPASLTWTAHAGNVYKATRSATQLVADTRPAHRAAWNDYAVYTQKANAAAVTGPGQWAIESNVVYVWALGDANLVTDSSFLRLSINVAGTGIQVNNGVTVYVEGIDTEGTGTPTSTGFGAYSFGSVSGLPTLILKDCTAKYSPLNGFGHAGAKLVIEINCYASSNARDAFSYHSGTFESQTVTPEFVEINCRSRQNGLAKTAGETDNGTTAHVAGTRGIRLNGLHRESFGPLIADVLGAKTWNLNTLGKDSTAVTRKWAFNTADAGSVQLNEECASEGNLVGMYAASTSAIKVRGGRYEDNVELAVTTTGGTVTRY